jgi:hypothetical protein
MLGIFALGPENTGKLRHSEGELETSGAGAFGMAKENYLCRRIGGSEWAGDVAQANPRERF